ncbi:MAG: PKD domain-containing protein [Actinomycetota bacterium]|nr:PKD domain-containing protein [Actinomycetota bacterium]
MYGNALSAAHTGVNRRVSPLRNNTNLVGEPAPTRLAWDPTFNAGTYTGQYQAGWSVTGNRDYVIYGGEFPRVNGLAQQGLVRFAVRPLAPNKVAPRATGTFGPTATPIPGAVRISWKAVHDRDNEKLTYQVYRDVESGTPVCQVTHPSQWWDLRTYGCADTTAPVGSHRYLVVARDPLGNRLASTWATATVGLANRSADRPYARLVAADGAQDHWALGETGGTVARDRLVPQDMTINPGVTLNQAGATTGDGNRAFAFNSTTGFLASATAVPGPHTFSVEAWFSTTTRAGGKIVGFGNARTGTSSNFDRHIYMDTAGRLNFGVFNGAAQAITTAAAFNDGGWHHVVGTLGRNGMSLYVDGQLVRTRPEVTSAQYFPGFWRVGGDSTWSGSRWFAGRIDEVAVYPTALSAQQVAAHNTAARTGQAPNVAPTASFTAASNHLEVALDASTSGDSDGRLTRYAWAFGDGTTGEGVTARHTYAGAGTYTVRLTVTDDRAGTATTTREVTVTAPPVGPGSIATDAFGRELSSGWGRADLGGTWSTYGAAANMQVTGGQGHVSAGPGTSAGGTLPVSAQDVAVQADVVLDRAPTGGGSYLALGARSVGGTRYKTQLWFAADGSVHMGLIRVVDWVETLLASTPLPGRYTPGTALTVRVEVDGTAPAALKAKAWAKGTAEPVDWQVRAADTTAALQRAGGLRLDLYTARSATTATAVRVDDLRAEPAGTVVAQPEPAPNAAPTAAFTATPADLTAAFDASASSDADGRVTGYAWDFGDGGTGTGATGIHTYAVAGTYQVRLTVTDDAGATGTVTKAVTVTAPGTPPPAEEPAVQPLATDAFAREVTGGLGTADVGGTWATHGTAANLEVTGGQGHVTAAPGTSAGATLPVSAQDVAVQADVVLEQAPTGGGSYLALGARSVGGTRYKTQLWFAADGSVHMGLIRVVDWVETLLASTPLPGRYTPGTALTVRFEVGGTSLQAKAWTKGTAEPVDWQVQAADTTAALQRPGGLRLDLYTARSATAASTVRVDDLWAGAAGTVPPAA